MSIYELSISINCSKFHACNIHNAILTGNCYKGLKYTIESYEFIKGVDFLASEVSDISKYIEERSYMVEGINIKNGEKIVFKNPTEAARTLGQYNNSKICDCCNGKRKSAAGYTWRYIK